MSPFKSITKAVLPVAGMGTRFLPATKAMPKELLPIIDKPVVQYAVEEAVAAGINEIIFVTGRTKRAIEDHFVVNPTLEAELVEKDKHDLLELVRDVTPSSVDFVFVQQGKALGLGHAVSKAQRVIGDDPFAVLLADNFFLPQQGNPTKSLVAHYGQTGKNVLLAEQVTDCEVHKFGIIAGSHNHDTGSVKVSEVVEKPTLASAPSNLASMGRYILQPEIMQILRSIPAGVGGEIQLTDAINVLAKSGDVQAIVSPCKAYDCGSKEGYLEAIVDAALVSANYSEHFRKVIVSRSQ